MKPTRGAQTGWARVALVGAAAVASALVTTGIAYGLATTPVHEPAAVSWLPGASAPPVSVVADFSARTTDCGGYVTELPAGAAVPEPR